MIGFILNEKDTSIEEVAYSRFRKCRPFGQLRHLLGLGFRYFLPLHECFLD